MYASAGSVEKKAVSKIATWVMSGRARRAASMPAMPGGLCNGASGLSSRRVSTMASSITVVPANFEPPWTVRCPTALISARSGPWASNTFTR